MRGIGRYKAGERMRESLRRERIHYSYLRRVGTNFTKVPDSCSVRTNHQQKEVWERCFEAVAKKHDLIWIQSVLAQAVRSA